MGFELVFEELFSLGLLEEVGSLSEGRELRSELVFSSTNSESVSPISDESEFRFDDAETSFEVSLLVVFVTVSLLQATKENNSISDVNNAMNRVIISLRST